MPSYTNPFSGQTINPASVSYEALSISVNTELQWPVNGNTNTPVSSIIDVTATTTGLLLKMPPAQQVSTGQSALIRNVGTNTFTVTDNSGNTIVAVTSGVSQFIFVTDNTTVNGVWSSVVFGAGTSSANAAALAGYGLAASGLTLNQVYPVFSYGSSTTLTAANSADLSVWTGGVGTLTLPSAVTVGTGWFITIKNNGTGILTLTPAGAETIDGNASQQLQLAESISLVSNGTNWSSFGIGRSNTFAYTQLALSVTGGTRTLSSVEAANTIQVYSGALTSNEIIVVPSTVQLYTFTNNTTGSSYSFTVKTAASGGAVVTIQQGTSLVLICDGTNVYNAASGSTSNIGSLTVGDGSLATPSIKFNSDPNTGIYLSTVPGALGFVVANALAGYFNSTGLTVTNGISGGTF
jgi:hypothetical protein